MNIVEFKRVAPTFAGVYEDCVADMGGDANEMDFSIGTAEPDDYAGFRIPVTSAIGGKEVSLGWTVKAGAEEFANLLDASGQSAVT